MPDPFRLLASEVQDLEVLPAAEVRARGRRRGRRRLAATAMAVAVVASTAGVAATRTFGSPDGPTEASGFGANQPAYRSAGPTTRVVPCRLDLPSEPSQVRIRLLDGGAPAGVVAATATELRERRFVVLSDAAGPADPAAGPATVRFGPAAVGAASVVRAYVFGESTAAFDPARRDDTVDLTLGPGFDRLATSTEVNRALVTAGEPIAPPQC